MTIPSQRMTPEKKWAFEESEIDRNLCEQKRYGLFDFARESSTAPRSTDIAIVPASCSIFEKDVFIY